MKYTTDKHHGVRGIEGPHAGTSFVQRRRFLTGLTALGAGALLPGCASDAPAPR